MCVCEQNADAFVQVVKIAPYLVCTLEMILTTFHFMASELIDDDVFNVMQALCKVRLQCSSRALQLNFNNNDAILRSAFLIPS